MRNLGWLAACLLAAVALAQAAEPGVEQLRGELARAQQADGPESLTVATALDKLATLLHDQGRFEEALPLCVRSLAIREKLLGPEHPDVGEALNNLASVYRNLGRYAEAEPLNQRSVVVFEKARGADHPDFATALGNLASLYLDQSRYPEAEGLFKRGLAIREKALGPDHADVGESLNNIASAYVEQGRYDEAEPLHLRALAISEKAYGPDHPDVASSLNNLAMVYLEQGRFGKAQPLLVRSIAIREKALGAEHPGVATLLSNLAYVHQAQGRYAEAEPLYRRSLAIREKAFGATHRTVAASLNNLASLVQEQGRYAEAEQFFVRSLEIREQALGGDHPEVAGSLNNLALLYQAQGRAREAEPLYRRALALWEKSFGPEHPETASFLNNLGTLYRDHGRPADAVAPFVRSVAIREKAFGAEHPTLAISLSNLGALHRDQGRHDDARPLLERSLAIRQKALGSEHPDVALSLVHLARLDQAQRRPREAEARYRRSIAISEGSLGPDHLHVARALNHLADLSRAQGRAGDALGFARRASAIYRGRIVAATDDASPRESAANRAGFFRHLALLTATPAASIDESFAIAQLAQATGTGAAVARMAARFSRGSDALATLVKRKQDLVERVRRAEGDLVKAASEPPDKRDRAAEQGVRAALGEAHRDLAAVDTELQSRFPEYQLLTGSQPLEVRAAQALLRPDEALLVYCVGPESGWLWVVRPKSAAFLPLKVGEKNLALNVGTVRAGLLPDRRGDVHPADVGALHRLYRAVFAPAAAHLAGAKHLMVVPAGALQSLPFGMLVASPPAAIVTPADYRKVDWLARRHAISVLPSVGSLRALREFAKAAVGREPFVGFGDPQLKDLPGLPETADELRAMAKTLGAGEGSVLLRGAATETAVKSLDLSRFRVIAFATHGLMAGELGMAEPGLLLTPPATPSADDDGYLSAAEIAQLRLNADWVLLSACNTAAADGTPGAEGLSGLAKSFFYAGSRSLLVSHWPVASEATVPLTTTMLREYQAHPARGKSEALRRAMLALMQTPGRPEYAHPFFWAPFILVGEDARR